MVRKTVAATAVFAIYACSMFFIAAIPDNTAPHQTGATASVVASGH
jgi:hypothetical protein